MFKTGSANRILFDTLPERSFIRLDELKTLAIPHPEILFKTKSAVSGVDLENRELIALPFGRLFAVLSASITIGYRIQTPKCQIEVSSNYVKLQRRAGVFVKKTERYFANNDLFIYGNEQALLIISNVTDWLRDFE